jgi:hypothetical protein
MPAFIDLTGQTFGRLTVLRRNPQNTPAGASRFDCLCVCGNRITTAAYRLKLGMTKSCGCLQRELTRLRHTTHGHAGRGRQTSEWARWQHMIGRCHHPKNADYDHYGGRGIGVCDEWRKSFAAYLAYIRSIGFTGAKGQELDRIDNDGNYEPGNLRVTDRKGQCRNKRNNRTLTAFGQTCCLSEWGEQTGIKSNTIQARLARSHWPVEKALTTPVKE